MLAKFKIYFIHACRKDTVLQHKGAKQKLLTYQEALEQISKKNIKIEKQKL